MAKKQRILANKNEGASILHDKVQEICSLIPSFQREIDWGRGKTLEGKDKVKYVFKNGSTLDNLAARESTRGQRRHGGLMEECVGIDDAILREVIIPIMAIPRRAKDGSVHENEPVNKSQIYINFLKFSVIAKKLAKENFLNCWKTQPGQSAAKLNIKIKKVQRLS